MDAGDLVSRVTGIASTALAAVTGFLIVLFLGLYLAAEPGLYTAGILRLVPRHHRERAGEVLAKLYETLEWWLVARLASMAVIGVLTWIGLAALGIPLAFLLAVLAAILTFVPYVGPVLSALIPALLALAQSPMKALWVIVLFLGIQTIESYLITPLIERKAVRLPPALTIIAQVLFTLIAGPLGLLLASPLVAVLMVLVQMLYVEDALGDTLPHVGAGR
jgi:predicted PurR-regulated permease PerM